MGKSFLIIIVLSSVILLGGCASNNGSEDNGVKQQANSGQKTCGTIEVADNLDAYNQLAVPEKQTVGTLEDNGTSNTVTVIQRYSRYTLSGTSLAPISKDLSAYVGEQVVVIGKQYKFELEGQLLDELWAKSISCR